jgi:spore coat polysaccharide biosynthesis protein SpsF
MRTVIISQARMGSTRLPGKVLREAAGKPFLQHHLERLRRVTGAHDVWIATTTDPRDDAIVGLCDRLGFRSFRGSEDDVLSRYAGTAQAAGAERIVRVTSDCPLIDPGIVDRVIGRMDNDRPSPDYVSNTQIRSFPRGLDCEVFTREALDEAQAKAQRIEEREHVTPYIYWRPERFRIAQVVSETDLSAHRWTVDTPEDERLVRLLLEAGLEMTPDFGLAELLAIIARNPEWAAINAHIEQKVVRK